MEQNNKPPTSESSAHRPRVGLALGGGSARGWAHIGVLRALADLGVQPDTVCGTSIGALVGGFYAARYLDSLQPWVETMNRREVARFLDVTLIAGGGLIEGSKLMEHFRKEVGDLDIGQLATAFAAVATELDSGREVWLRDGSLIDAVRASIALPGLFTPVKHGERWLVDGGLTNPVPVSLCRAMGAEVVIAVNLNHNIVSRRSEMRSRQQNGKEENNGSIMGWLTEKLRSQTTSLKARILEPRGDRPSLYDVLSNSIYIMQDRITRSRMAGDPPDIMLTPRLADIGLMEFERGREAIAEGRACVERQRGLIEELVFRR